MSTSDNQRAGYLAVAAALVGLVAVIGIIFAGSWGGEAASAGPAAEEAVPSRGLESPGSARRVVGLPGANPGAPDAGRSAAGSTAPSGLLGGSGLLSEAPPGSGLSPTVAPGTGLPGMGGTEGSSPGEPGSEAPRPPLELTPEQRFEAHAFLEDLVTLRLDSLRREIAEARRIGDGRSLRRLEPALTVLEEEATRLAARRRELERELPSPPEEGAEAGDEAGEATDPAPAPE